MNKYSETTNREMQRILATDLGVEPEQIVGHVIVVAMQAGAENMQPVVRSNLGPTMAAYIMTSATADLLFMTVSDANHPEHGDVCPIPPGEHEGELEQ